MCLGYEVAAVVGNAIAKLKVLILMQLQFSHFSIAACMISQLVRSRRVITVWEAEGPGRASQCFNVSFFSQKFSPKSQIMMGILSSKVQMGLPFKSILYHLCKSTAEAAYADSFQFYLVQANVRFLNYY